MHEEPRKCELQIRLCLGEGDETLIEVIEVTPVQGTCHPEAVFGLTVASVWATLQANAVLRSLGLTRPYAAVRVLP